MGEPQECYGFPPANYDGQSDPKSIEFNGVSMVLATLYLLVFMTYDYRARRIPLTGKTPGGATGLEDVKVAFVMPIIIWFVIIYMCTTTIFANFFGIIIFEGLRSDSNPNAKEYACYAQWWSEGSVLYGNLGIITLPCFIAYLSFLFFVLIGKNHRERGGITSFLFHCCPEQTRSKEQISSLIIGAAAGETAVYTYWHLNTDNSSYKGRVKLLVADKYGVEHGEQCGNDVKVVEATIRYNNYEDGMTCVDLPIYGDWTSPAYLNLEPVADKSQDFVQVKAWFASWLDVMFDEKDSYIRKSRYINAFTEIHRVLKDDGYFLKVCSGAEEIEELRDYLRQSGFRTAAHERPGEPKSINIFGQRIVLYVQSSQFFLVAKKQAGDAEGGDDIRLSMRETNRKTLASLEAKAQLEDPAIEKHEWQAVWAFFLALALLVWAAIFVITVEYFNDMRFPVKTGFNNYFVWNMMGIISSTPMNVLIFMSIYWFRISRLPRVTNAIVWNTGWAIFSAEYILGMITTVPMWLISTGFSYYVVERMIGLPVNSWYNSLLTVLFVIVIIRGLIFLVFRKKKNEIVIAAKEFEFTFDPAYVSSDPNLRSVSSTKSEQMTPLHVEH